MGFFQNILHAATTTNPKKSIKQTVGLSLDPAGTTIRVGRGKDALPSNAKGAYDPAGLTTPTVIGAPPTHAPPAPVDLPPIGSHGTLAPPLPGMGGMSSPKMVPTMQSAANAAAAAQATPGGSRAFKSTAAPAYQFAQSPQGGLGASPYIPAPGPAPRNAKVVK